MIIRLQTSVLGRLRVRMETEREHQDHRVQTIKIQGQQELEYILGLDCDAIPISGCTRLLLNKGLCVLRHYSSSSEPSNSSPEPIPTRISPPSSSLSSLSPSSTQSSLLSSSAELLLALLSSSELLSTPKPA